MKRVTPSPYVRLPVLSVIFIVCSNFAWLPTQDTKPAQIEEPQTKPVELKSAKVWFKTTEDEKESDTKVSVYIQTPEWNVVAKRENISGDFRTNSINQYELQVDRRIKKNDISGCHTTVQVVVATEDTWIFEYKIELTFSDESKITNTFPVTLSESDPKKSFRLQNSP
jgi:hypothetical protein